MSYMHNFYGLELARLQRLYGSNDLTLLNEILQSQEEALRDNDSFFESYIDDGDAPSSESALREIFAGKPRHNEAEAMYGYVLGIICEHIGSVFGEEVCCIGDHPYKSLLVSAGPPLPIPYDPNTFPEIGHLSYGDLPAEIALVDAALSKLETENSRRPHDEVAEDMELYRETLEEAMERKMSIVSLRH